MNLSRSFGMAVVVLLAGVLPAAGGNIASYGTGIMGSNDATIGDMGSSHFNQGMLSYIRDASEETRVDTWLANPNPANVHGFAGVRWSQARPDLITSVKVTLATFINGGWFGNRECPELGQRLTESMLVPPVVQVSRSSTLAEWVTVPSTTDYVSRLTGHAIAADSFPTRQSFTITLAEAQKGVYGIRVIGPTGGFNPGTGFLGVFGIAVEASFVVSDYDRDELPEAWEITHGFDTMAQDGELDPDGDGLTNLQEFRWKTNPHVADTDADGVLDAAEIMVHGTWPANADSDDDLLGDNLELNSFGTDPLRADSDGDGLADGQEVTVHSTSPKARDHDGDGFPDGREIAHGTSPTNAASRPSNIALAATGLLGRNAGTSIAQLALPGTPRANAGATARVIDRQPLTLAHTRDMTGSASHAGLAWETPWPNPVARLEVTLATSSEGGWFGNTNPISAGTPLSSTHLVEPALQTTVDGTTWVTLDPNQYTSNYMARMEGHRIGGGTQPAVTRRGVTFSLTPPIAGLRGIRVAGAHRHHLGIAEISATDTTTPDDVDGDGLSTAEESTHGSDPLHIDADEDGLTDHAEAVTHRTNPSVTDTDGDGFLDGLEIIDGTNPLSATHTGNLARFATGLVGINNAIDTDAGQTVTNSGIASYISDGNLATRVDTWNGTNAWRYGFLGLRWNAPRALNVLRVHFATFNNGGWFGPTNTGPVPGEPLLPSHLVEPTVQVSTNGGTTWTTVPHTSNYLDVMPGHRIGETYVYWCTRSPAVTFNLATPAFGINAVRVIGLEGGSHESFVGAFDVAAFLAAEGPDIDANGLPDAWEMESFGGLAGRKATDDTDGDGSVELVEYAFGMNPTAFDQPPAAAVEAGHLTLTLAKRPMITYVAEASSSLGTWSTDGLEVVVDDAATLRVRDPVPVGEGTPQRFVRVRVMSAPPPP